MKDDISKNLMSLSSKVDKEKKYWLNKLSGELIKTHFPYDFNKADTTQQEKVEDRADKIESQWPQDLVLKLNRITNRSDNNLYTILLAGLTLLLYKYTGHTDILIGAPIYKQSVEGDFINTVLIIRNRFSQEETFKKLILQVKKNLAEANDHLNYPIERLLYHLDIPTSDHGEGFSLFETVILLENIHDRKYIRDITPRILLSFSQKEDQFIEGVMEYNARLYKKETIQRIMTHLMNLLQGIEKTINQTISGIDILSEEEQRQLLFDFNNTRADYQRVKTIRQLFEEQAEKTPGSTAVVCPIDNNSLEYRELNEKSHQLAGVIREKGIKPGTVAAIMAEPSVEMTIGILAVLKAGGAYLPINPDSPHERIRYILADSNAGILLTTRSVLLTDKPRFDTHVIYIEDQVEHEQITAIRNLQPLAPPSDPVYVIYTSGTTGKPKGVLITNQNLVNYTSWLSKALELTTEDRTVLTSSFSFDLGYSSIYGALLNGGQLHLLSLEQYIFGETLLNYIKENQITFLKITPSLFSLMVHSPDFSMETCASLRVVLLGGESIVTADVELAHRRCSHIRVMNHYGPTEATIGCIAQFIYFDTFEQYKKNPTIGKPISNTSAYILAKNLKPLPIGAPGELCISGTCLVPGYLNRPELTVEKFDQDFQDFQDYQDEKGVKKRTSKYSFTSLPLYPSTSLYRTGDLARWLPEGNIEFLGRIDHQVKIRGLRIELGEIENQLIRHNEIEEAVVILKGNEKEDKYICAYCVSNNQTPVSELREYLLNYLPEYMIPSYFIMVDRISLTPNGKIDRKALPEPEIGIGAGYIAPRNESEEKLVDIWADVLGREKETIGIDSNFFDLGGQSLKATLLVARIHRELDVRLPIGEIFRTPMIRELSQYIEGAIKEKFFAVVPAEKKEYYPLSSAQNRLYFIYLMEPDSTAYNVPSIMVLEGDIDRNRLEDAFRELIKRHESLRTSYMMLEEASAQRVHDTIDGDIDVDFAIEYYEDGEEVEKIVQNFVRPFDLSKAPQLRVGLVKEREERFIFMVDRHHIMTDGISRGILERDFMSLYAGNERPPLKLHYKDFSQWQNQLLHSGVINKQEEYWINRFKGDIPTLNLPTDYPRTSVRSSDEGALIDFTIDKELTAVLKETLKETGTTQFMYMLAVYNVLLAKYSGQDDIVVGSPVTGRRHSDLEIIIGLFINMLSIRNRPAEEKSFKEFLEDVKENALNAYENQDFQFEELVSKLGLQGITGRNPLFSVVFADMNLEAPEIENPQLALQPYGLEKTTSKFDLRLTVAEYGDIIEMTLTYSTALFKRTTAERMTKRFIEILQQVLENRDIKLKNIAISHDLVVTKSSSLQDYQETFDF